MGMILFQSSFGNEVACDIKKIPRSSVDQAGRVYGISHKEIAMSLGLNPKTAESVLTKYMNNPEYHFPADLVVLFCQATRDWTLLRYFSNLHKRHGRRSA